MIDVFIQAAHDFIQTQLNLETTSDTHFQKNLFHRCSIELQGANKKSYLIFYYSDTFIRRLSDAMLFEPEPDEATVTDLTKESTNQIAGAAKMLIPESSKEHFNIGLPHYEGMHISQNSGTLRAFYIDDEPMFQLVLQG